MDDTHLSYIILTDVKIDGSKFRTTIKSFNDFKNVIMLFCENLRNLPTTKHRNLSHKWLIRSAFSLCNLLIDQIFSCLSGNESAVSLGVLYGYTELGIGEHLDGGGDFKVGGSKLS